MAAKGRVMEIEWRDVPDYEGFYKVSNYGDVCSLDRIVSNGRRLKGRVLKHSTINGGHHIVRFSRGQCKQQWVVARLVWTVFHGDIPDGYGVSYRDGNRDNCRLDNLYLATLHDLASKRFHPLWFEDLTPEKLARLYSNKSQLQIAKQFDITKKAVNRRLAVWGITKTSAEEIKTNTDEENKT